MALGCFFCIVWNRRRKWE